jgi:hypothetical protein
MRHVAASLLVLALFALDLKADTFNGIWGADGPFGRASGGNAIGGWSDDLGADLFDIWGLGNGVYSGQTFTAEIERPPEQNVFPGHVVSSTAATIMPSFTLLPDAQLAMVLDFHNSVENTQNLYGLFSYSNIALVMDFTASSPVYWGIQWDVDSVNTPGDPSVCSMRFQFTGPILFSDCGGSGSAFGSLNASHYDPFLLSTEVGPFSGSIDGTVRIAFSSQPFDEMPTNQVPEPATVSLIASGLAILIQLRRRCRN